MKNYAGATRGASSNYIISDLNIRSLTENLPKPPYSSEAWLKPTLDGLNPTDKNISIHRNKIAEIDLHIATKNANLEDTR